ncbi:MAG: hypothetical protein D8H95_42370 [Lachnospiraceae bacterium]|jgi:hypothetical protein|nr:MAG: hypothetical protein D8H95_42370 [Lachnospiraceae bacterium]
MRRINSVLKAAILAMVLPVVIPAGIKVANLSIGSSIIANAATPGNATPGNATQSNGDRGGSGGGGGSSRQGASGAGTTTGNRSINRSNVGTWVQDDKGWWYKGANGSYPKYMWMEIAYDGQTDWYYFDEQGYMLTGWRNINDKWYYLFEKTGGRAVKGAMAKGWIEINGKWYYLYERKEGDNPEGSLAVNTTIGGYRVDGNGVWVQ